MVVEGNVIVQCENCGHIQLIDKDYFDDYVSAYERNMGPEIEHEFAHDCDCELCGNTFVLVGNLGPRDIFRTTSLL